MFDDENLPPLEAAQPDPPPICDYDRIQCLVNELEALGTAVIVWTPDDYPGASADMKNARFAAHSKSLCEILIARGNDAIATQFNAEDFDGEAAGGDET